MRWNPDRCKRGHVLTDDTTYVSPTGRRECRPCRTEVQRASYLARTAGRERRGSATRQHGYRMCRGCGKALINCATAGTATAWRSSDEHPECATRRRAADRGLQSHKAQNVYEPESAPLPPPVLAWPDYDGRPL